MFRFSAARAHALSIGTENESIPFAGSFSNFWIALLYLPPRKSRNAKTNRGKLEFSIFKSAVYVLAGIFALSFGANFFVDGAIYLARFFGISEVVIGMSVVALGTSLPELATSAMAAFKKQSSISVGNIVGSNIFNILSILGITALFRPIDSPTNILNFEMPYMVAYCLVLILIAKLPQPVHRLSSCLLLLSYFLFIYLLF